MTSMATERARSQDDWSTTSCRQLHPSGVPDISRGLSEATPPETRRRLNFHPGGVTVRLQMERETVAGTGCQDPDICGDPVHDAATTPPGSNSSCASFSGGVASLNRRLMALTPHEVDPGSRLPDIFPTGGC